MTRRTEPTAALMVSDFKMVRRDTGSEGISALQLSFPGLAEKILRGPPREGHDGEGGILVGIGDKRSGVGHEEIPDIVGLAIAVQGRGLRVAAHAHSAQFMDDLAALRDVRGLRKFDSGAYPRMASCAGNDRSARGFN